MWRPVSRHGALNARAKGARDDRARRHVTAGALAYAEQRALERGLAVAAGANTILLDEPAAGMGLADIERAVEPPTRR